MLAADCRMSAQTHMRFEGHAQTSSYVETVSLVWGGNRCGNYEAYDADLVQTMLAHTDEATSFRRA
jgi:hypothetical protein